MRDSRFARRITGQTPMTIGGPAAGDDRLKTIDDPNGTTVLGTLNNCAMGFTPWGTYLTCEENFNGFFFRTLSPDSRSPLEKRYGISPSNGGFRWYTTHPRFNADIYGNESNRFGWVVEIDPFAPHSTPVKRTALGRLKHEGAWVQEARDGKIVVYMGDDERNAPIGRRRPLVTCAPPLRQQPGRGHPGAQVSIDGTEIRRGGSRPDAALTRARTPRLRG